MFCQYFFPNFNILWTFFFPIWSGHYSQNAWIKPCNFKFDKNGRKLSKWVENTVGKGEIACYEQFLLFPQCFQKAGFLGASKDVIVWEWVNAKTQ